MCSFHTLFLTVPYEKFRLQIGTMYIINGDFLLAPEHLMRPTEPLAMSPRALTKNGRHILRH